MEIFFLQRGRNVGVWLSIALFTVNIMDIGDQKYRETIFFRYGIEPSGLPHHYNGFGSASEL